MAITAGKICIKGTGPFKKWVITGHINIVDVIDIPVATFEMISTSIVLSYKQAKSTENSARKTRKVHTLYRPFLFSNNRVRMGPNKAPITKRVQDVISVIATDIPKDKTAKYNIIFITWDLYCKKFTSNTQCLMYLVLLLKK